MKRFKKLLCVVLAVMTMSVLFAGCGKNDGEANDSGSAEFEKLRLHMQQIMLMKHLLQ